MVILIPFVRDQVLTALYPQVGVGEGTLAEMTEGGALGGARKRAIPAPVAPAPMATAPAGPPVETPRVANAPLAKGEVQQDQAAQQEQKIEPQRLEYEKRKGGFSSVNVALEQDPRAVIQTGPGVPTWSWSTSRLDWTGPVKHDQTLRLWLVSPGMNRLLTFVRLLLVLLLAVRLLVDGASIGSSRGATAAAAVTLVLLALAGRPASAQDAIPDSDLLEELKNRLDRREACQPECLTTATLHVRLAADTLTFAAEVHAADDAAWALPGPPASWAPAVVRVDGQATGALARLDDGFLYVRLAKGVHRVEAAGPAPRADTLTVQLRDRPRRADADTPGWDVSGMRADGPPDASIQLSRRLRAGERAREEAGGYAPWLEVTRTLTLGLTWRVRTDVRRVSPSGAPIALRVPLLAGEEPTEADLQTEDGVALVSLGRDQTEAGWSSTLPVTEALALKAPEGQPWSEVWRMECGVIWECEAAGLPPVSHQRGGILAPEFRPWPGETLGLKFRHPQAVAGQTVTLQSVRVETTPGDRLTTTSLTVATRASRDEPLVLAIPADAEVQEVTVGGSPRPAKPDQGRLRVTVPAGAQTVVVRWREPHGMGLFRRVPAVGLPVPAVNVETVLHVPENRWLLLARGPSWGPAVLFWGYLLFALVVALGLGLFAESPLGIGAWLLLALGLTQASAVGGLLVAGLFLVLAWRARRPRSTAVMHDLLQLLLVVWILAALAVLYGVIEQGLSLRPDMQVAGAASSNTVLRWYSDRVEGTTPAAGVLSVPLWVYRGLMLAWALWLAASLVRWAGWGWRAMGEGGFWRRLGKETAAPVPPPA